MLSQCIFGFSIYKGNTTHKCTAHIVVSYTISVWFCRFGNFMAHAVVCVYKYFLETSTFCLRSVRDARWYAIKSCCCVCVTTHYVFFLCCSIFIY